MKQMAGWAAPARPVFTHGRPMTIKGSKYDWKLEPPDAALVEAVARASGVSTIMAGVMAARGVGSGEAAKRFMEAADDPLPDAGLLPDADRVVERVTTALESGELIAVHGHDDADGVTATTIMVEALDQLGAAFTSYIPDRKTEGHGLGRDELDRLAAAGVGLIITVDSCVSDREYIAYGKSLGMDTIVTDHHEIPPELPPAVAIVNPKLPGSPFPYRYMAGVGVSLRVADLLLDRLGGRFGPASQGAPWYGPRWRVESLALAAIGSIADKVPLTEDNRSIVTQGLAAIPRTERSGLRAVLEEARMWGRDVSPSDVREALGPVLGRAPGETPGAQRPFRLLTSRDLEQARVEARGLLERQERWRITAAGAWKRVRSDFDRLPEPDAPVTILESEVPVGAVGYVTSRLAEETGKPSIVITRRDGLWVAEARGPAGFNFVDAFSTMSELFKGYGGHPRAAGFSIPSENIPTFRERMAEFVAANPAAPEPRRLDGELALKEATGDLAEELERLRPFGQGNRRALFLSRGVTADVVARAESLGTRFGTPMRAGVAAQDLVVRLRSAEGVPLVSVVDVVADGREAGGARSDRERA